MSRWAREEGDSKWRKQATVLNAAKRWGKMKAKQWPLDLVTWRSLRKRTISMVQWGRDRLKVVQRVNGVYRIGVDADTLKSLLYRGEPGLQLKENPREGFGLFSFLRCEILKNIGIFMEMVQQEEKEQ